MSGNKPRTKKNNPIKISQPTESIQPTEKSKTSEIHWYNKMTLYISLGALVISLFSLLFTRNEYILAEKQELEKRYATWIGTYNKEKQELSIKSSTEDITLQLANVYFPSEIDKQKWNINPPDYTLPTTVLENAFAEFIDKNIERDKDNYQVLTGDIPMVIDSTYIAFGYSASIKSHYNVRFIATVSEKEFELPTVEIQGMWLDTHLPTDVDPRKYLDDLWKEGLKQQKPQSIYQP